MTTVAARAMRATVDQFHPVLRAAGFRKRRHAFNRTVEPGLVQVVTFLMGPSDPPGLVEIPGLRENLYGLFSVHLGVFVEEAWRLDFGRFTPDGAPVGKDWVNDYDCQLRRLVDNPAPEAKNRMWPLDEPGAGAAVLDLLRTVAFPWFDRFDGRAAILSALLDAPIGGRAVAGLDLDRMLAVRMLLGAGERGSAQQHFDDYVSYCERRVEREPHVRGHLQYLADWAARVGLDFPGG